MAFGASMEIAVKSSVSVSNCPSNNNRDSSMEIVWITEKVVDAEGVITHIDWTARAWESVYQAMRSGRAALPSPDPDLLAQYLSRNPEHGRYVFKRNEDDATGFVSADRIERDTLHPWLFELIDRGAIEAELVDEIRAAQTPLTVDTPSAAALVNAAEEGPREYPEADPRDDELKAALARAAAAEARVAELEAEKPQQLPPNPAEAKLSDYGPVGSPQTDPVENEITTEHLLDAMRANPVTTQDVIAKLTSNKSNLADIKTAINAGNKPDLEAGYALAVAVP